MNCLRSVFLQLAAAISLVIGASSGALVGLSHAQPVLGAWIDPGHGGKDPGAVGIDGDAAPNEEHLTLAISLVVQSRLAQLGYLSLLTRNSDFYWTKTRRAQIAAGEAQDDQGDQEQAVVCVSVHADAVKDTTIFGTEVIHPAEKIYFKSRRAYRADSTFGSYVYPALISNAALAFLGCHDPRGLKRDVRELTVLRKAKIPTVLAECGFISNRCQFNNMRQSGDQGLLGNGIATGIANYLGAPSPHLALSSAEPSALGSEARATTRPQAPSRVLVGTLQEDFENASFPPSGWVVTGIGSVPFAWHRQTDPLYVAAGTGAALVSGESPGAVDELLISPMILVSVADSSLSFRWLGNPFFAGAANARCSVRRKGETAWVDIWTLQQEPHAGAFKYLERVVGLSAWLGDSVQIGFRVSGSNGADFALDDVVTGVAAPTAPPANDQCGAAIVLPAGTSIVTGSTCYATNNRDPFVEEVESCVPDEASGGDVFYLVNALVGDTISVEASSMNAFRPHLYLLSSCDSLSATCVAGNGPADSEGDPSFSHVFTSAGTYLLAVDGIPDECGAYSFTATLRGPVTGVGEPTHGYLGPRLVAAPNPARGTILFSAVLPPRVGGEGVLRVFDAAGRVVLEQTCTLESGRTQVIWDARDRTGTRIPAGVYLAALDFGGGRTTARVTLIR